MEDRLLERAGILIEQNRHKDARKVLAEVVATDPTDVHALTMYSQVMLALDDPQKANELIDSAIQYAPDLHFVHYVKSTVQIELEQYDAAEASLKTAAQLNPFDADIFAFWGQIKLIRKKYEEAVALADKGLAINAQHVDSLNVRSSALMKLNRKEDSNNTIKGALREDPNNAYTHANYGWNLLEQGKREEALEHFREALKNDPSNEYAQAGMLEAIRSKHFLYNLFLKYSFWMGKLSSQYQWAVIFGFYFGFRFIRQAAESNPSLQPFLYPILGVLAFMALSTWIITPISNLFLRFNPNGKYLLDEEDIKSSNLVAISIFTCVAGLLLFLFTKLYAFLTLAAVGFGTMIPFSVVFTKVKNRNLLFAYTGALVVVGILAVLTSFTNNQVFNLFTIIFMLGLFAFQFLVNYLMIKRSNV